MIDQIIKRCKCYKGIQPGRGVQMSKRKKVDNKTTATQEKGEEQKVEYDSPKVLLKPLLFLIPALGGMVVLKILMELF